MPDDFETVLDSCLTMIALGEAGVEACLAAHPEHASELEPLLQSAALLADAPRQGPSSEAAASGARRLAAGVELKRTRNESKRQLERGGKPEMTQSFEAKSGDVVLMVGTKKGAFLLSSDVSRRSWTTTAADAHFTGSDVFHMAYDSRDGSVFAAINNLIFGPDVQRSPDLGKTWEIPTRGPRFSSGDRTLSRVWHVEPGRADEPGVVYLGVEPAALLKSYDSGDTWSEVVGLTNHETRERWEPGLGGLCLHSMVFDPARADRMWVGISTVGVFGTEDGGETWETMNRGVRADHLPNKFPEFGQCPHKLVAHRARPEVLYQQNHCGVFRSDSGGASWDDITGSLPSRFGFVLGLHSRDPDTLYVIPEDQALGDEVGGFRRFVTEAKFRVFRSRDAGFSWEPLTNGLPQRNAYLHVMREGMATDTLDPCGIYVGTTSGQIFYSRDDGDSWELLIEYLPPINSVDCAIVV